MNEVANVAEEKQPFNEKTTPTHDQAPQRLDKILFVLTVGFILAFCTLAIVDIDALSAAVVALVMGCATHYAVSEKRMIR